MTPRDIYDFHVWFTETFQHLLEQRASTFYQALMLAVARNAKTIVETGTAWEAGSWSAQGQSTVLLGAFAERYGCKLWTCDINPSRIANSRAATSQYANHIEYHAGDSVAFLRDFSQPIDLLYLDSFDFDPRADPNPPQDHALAEVQAAFPRLHTQSIVLLDDCDQAHGGKGGKAIPFLLGQGWQVIGLGWQVLMTHGFSAGTWQKQ